MLLHQTLAEGDRLLVTLAGLGVETKAAEHIGRVAMAACHVVAIVRDLGLASASFWRIARARPCDAREPDGSPVAANTRPMSFKVERQVLLVFGNSGVGIDQL